jgi:ribosomal protein S1
MKVGDTVKAKVFATEPYGIYLRYGGYDILVRVTDVPLSGKLTTKEFTSIGEELEVKLLSIIDSKNALGTLLGDKR